MIIGALPWLRRAWRFLPPPLRIPVLLIAAVIGVVAAVTGRKDKLRAKAAEEGELSGSASGTRNSPSAE